MKSECLAFTAIPHTSELFRDYLYNFSAVQPYFPVDPRDRAALVRHAKTISYDDSRRRAVAAILERQNRHFGASTQALANIERFRKGAYTALSGQQVGLFGGPLYSILKAVSAIRLARDASAQGTDCIPVFWLATEDHDLAEVDHVTLLDGNGASHRLQAPAQGHHDAPVSEIRFADGIREVVDRAAGLLSPGEIADLLRAAYAPGESFGSAFAKLFASLFGDVGLVLLDPSDPELHAIAKPLYGDAIRNAGALDAALLARGRELRAAGYHEQVKVTPESTLLFDKRNGVRTVIHRVNATVSPARKEETLDQVLLRIGTNDVGTGASSFTVGRERVSREDMLARIEAEPHRFSANVLLRPVVQDYLLPTLAYFGGPAEVAYFAQAAVVYQTLLGRVTPVLPRFSATLLDAKAQRLLKKYGLSLPDLFAGYQATLQSLATQALPPELMRDLEKAGGEIGGVIDQVQGALTQLDPTLARSATRARSRMTYEMQRLQRRAANAEARRNDEIRRHAQWLTDNLAPDKGLQEREIGGLSFVARHGRQLLEDLLECAGACPDHQVIYL